jgi:hypothetical protein
LAQQKDAPDPELRQMIDAFAKKYAEAINNNDAAATAAFYIYIRASNDWKISMVTSNMTQ